MSDEVSTDELAKAIKHTHGVDATWVESVHVREMLGAAVAWEGEVQVFAVEHPKATRAYAWSHATTGTKRRFVSVLGAGPVVDAQMAVRAVLVAEARRVAN